MECIARILLGLLKKEKEKHFYFPNGDENRSPWGQGVADAIVKRGEGNIKGWRGEDKIPLGVKTLI